MAIWETPTVLSGETPATTEVKADLGLCMCHQMWVTMEWALRFRQLEMPNYIPFLNRNQPYDVAREQMTRACLDRDVKYIFHLDTDLLCPPKTIPMLIQIIEEKNLDIVCGLYFAKKREVICPAAWVKGPQQANKPTYLTLPNINEHIAKGDIVQVNVAGAGCMMVKADVFKKLEESNPKKPFFSWGLGRTREQYATGEPLLQTSEDFFFFERTGSELGIFPHIATAIQCDHICVSFKHGKDGHFELMRL